jgi:hypothetical protein
MKSAFLKYMFGVFVSVIILALLLAIVSFFYKDVIIEWLAEIGFEKLVGLVSGSWWNGLGTFVVGFGLIITILLTREQISEVRNSTNSQITLSITQELRSEENVKIIEQIYKFSPSDIKTLTSEQQRSVELVINRLSVLGLLIIQNILDKDMAIRNIAGTTSLRLWYRLYPFIRTLRSERGYYANDFEYFTRCSLDYFRKNKMRVYFQGGEDAQMIDIVEYLWNDPAIRPRALTSY